MVTNKKKYVLSFPEITKKSPRQKKKNSQKNPPPSPPVLPPSAHPPPTPPHRRCRRPLKHPPAPPARGIENNAPPTIGGYKKVGKNRGAPRGFQRGGPPFLPLSPGPPGRARRKGEGGPCRRGKKNPLFLKEKGSPEMDVIFEEYALIDVV